MADEPISGLTETTSVTGNEFLPIVQGGVTKKIKQSNLVPNQSSFSTTVLFDSNITMVSGVIYLEKNTNASNRSLTIPSATGNTGKFIFVAKQFNNGYTIACSGGGISSTLTRSNDSVLYVCDGTSWQPHLNISNELLLSLTGKEPTIASGTTSQYWRGDKTWQTFPTITTPTLDEVTDVGNTTTNSITVGGLVVNYPSGSGVATSITKGGAGEALTVTKTSGSGNVASFTGGTTVISEVELTNTTTSTLAFINNTKKIVTALGTTFGTWLNGLTAKTTVVDADVITTLDSASSFEAKKTTLLQLWTNYIKPKADASFVTVYVRSNYYRVDLNNGNDSTGLQGREDRPYLLIQTVWDLIATNNTAEITIEIIGDYSFTTPAIVTSVAKENITFLFRGKITNAIPATTTSRPLFTFTGICTNLHFNVPNYVQTTQGGFINAFRVNGFMFEFDVLTILMGINTSTVSNYGFYCANSSSECFFNAKNVTVNITNSAGSLLAYRTPFLLNNCNYNITTLTVTGTPTVASTTVYIFAELIKSLKIENLIQTNNYTNITAFAIVNNLTCENTYIGNVNISAGGRTIVDVNACTIFNNPQNCKNITIMSGTILNYACILSNVTTQVDCLNLGRITTTGVITFGYFEKTINLLGNITKSVASNGSQFMYLESNAILNGNGNRIYYTEPAYAGGSPIILLTRYGADRFITLNNLTLYNTNIATGSTQAYIPISYLGSNTVKLRCNNLTVSANLDNNTHANTTFIMGYNGSTSLACIVEGNVATNYIKNLTNITIDADIDLITGYRF
jgi:hypothetical protein